MPLALALRGPAAPGLAPARPSTSFSSRSAPLAPVVGRRRSLTRVGAGISLGEEAAFADAPGGRRPVIHRRQVYRSFEDEPEEFGEDDDGGEWEDDDAEFDGGAVASSAPSRSSGLLGPDGRPYDVPKTAYGLTLRQMDALGLAGEGGPGLRALGLDPNSLTSAAAYAASAGTRASAAGTTMRGRFSTPRPSGRGARRMGGRRRRRRPPPDLPSLLLDDRIVYIGMALVPQVTELIISELLWLDYASPKKPVSLYVHSTGSQTENGEQVAFENEAYAVIDTMRYIKPDVYTIVVGQCMGTATLLVASGKPGHRFALPNARLQVGPPRINRSFGRTANMMIKANELEKMTDMYADLLTQATGVGKAWTRRLIGRSRWLSPADAIEARIIDKVYDISPEQAAAELKHLEAAQKARAARKAEDDADMARYEATLARAQGKQ